MDGFEIVDFTFNFGRRVVGKNRNSLLENDTSAVVFATDHVDCDARFALAGSHNRFVYVGTIHAFPAELWKERGVYIDDALGVAVDEKFGNEEQKTGKYNGIDMVALHEGQQDCRVGNLLATKHFDRNAESASAFNDASFGTVADYECRIDIKVVRAEIFDDVLRIRAVARCKYCYSCHAVDR